MSYAPIELDAAVPEPIRAFVLEAVEPLLQDVRLMLALPGVKGQLGCQVAMAPALFSVIGGLSRVFFNGIAGDKTSFLATVERYPTAHEPANAIKEPKKFAQLLYVHYRGQLVHGLGLHMERDSRYVPWRLAPLIVDGKAMRIHVVRARSLPIAESVLAALDAPAGWPQGVVGPTLTLGVDALRLEVEALYAGVRRLTRQLAEDVSLQPGALAALQSWFAELTKRDDETAATILSSEPTRPVIKPSVQLAQSARDKAAGGTTS